MITWKNGTPWMGRRSGVVGLLASIGLLSGWMLACTVMPIPPETPPNPYSGRASLFRAAIDGTQYGLVDTGSLPPEGGELERSELDVNLAGILTAQCAHAAVIAQGLKSRAEASISKLDINLHGHHIKLDFLISRAKAECQAGQVVVTGSTKGSAFVVNGESLTISDAPNQAFIIRDLGGNEVGRIIVNEQVSSVNGSIGEITVNALHIVFPGRSDTVIVSAHADIKCPETPKPIEDFVTGGGFIDTTPSGSFANFGLAAGRRNGMLWGHLVYIDHGTDLKVKATNVTAYTIVDATTRHFEGNAEVNQVGGFTYQVDVVDNGEPGVDDRFTITLSNGYTATGVLVGGNIQIHN